MTYLIDFNTALEATKNIPKHILIGNGFSISQTEGEFSYKNLLAESDIAEESNIKNLFKLLKTVDFEEVIQALEHAAIVEKAYQDNQKELLFKEDANTVREGLIHAIRKVHPVNFTSIPYTQISSCLKFLLNFKNIFTLNYDLLLYWVILSDDDRRFKDGFGLAETEGNFRTPYKEEAYCNVFNLHGGLHLFLDELKDLKKRIVTNNNIIEDITQTIEEEKKLPLFVAEGTSLKKLSKINSTPYLRHCLNKMKELSGCLYIFGHSVNKSDYHIYDMIFQSSISNIYFFVYKPDENLQIIKESLAQFTVRNNNIEINYIDSTDLNIWNEFV